jgi:endonuclease YncB( thermonuclease family)
MQNDKCKLQNGQAPPLGITTRCRVIEVIDGDTLEVDVVKRVRVRLIDCWAPEIRTKNDVVKKAGAAAKKNMQYMAEDLDGVLFIPGHENNEIGDSLTLSRVVGQVWVDGPDKRSLAERQVAAGHASTHKGGRLGT